MSKYYSQHQQILDSIDRSYKKQYEQKPFSLQFTDKSFKSISIEIITDSIKYIYEFESAEARIQDTLAKYGLDVAGVVSLLKAMQSVHCTWINTLDYYTGGKKNSLVYMSIRSRLFNLPFYKRKYYILTYFSQPQYYDSEGRLLDRRKQRKIRKINDEIFRRINDKVCYTISDVFR